MQEKIIWQRWPYNPADVTEKLMMKACKNGKIIVCYGSGIQLQRLPQ